MKKLIICKMLAKITNSGKIGYKRVNHKLTNLKGIVSAYNNALFLWHDATGNLMGILAMHVDDFVISGNDLFQNLKKYSKLECMKVEHLNF